MILARSRARRCPVFVWKNPRNDGRDCKLQSEKCLGRPCLHLAENKGVFVQGRGYTHYYDNPELVCWTNHRDGCPYPYPEPDPEKVRCCSVPDFPKATPGVKTQKCRTCGQRASGWTLEARRSLPVLEHVDCRHSRARQVDVHSQEAWWCPDCKAYWERKPLPKQVGHDSGYFMEKWLKSLRGSAS